MGQPAKKPATYQDVLNAPEQMVAELIGGELYLSPRPSPAHAQSTTALVGELHGPFQRGRGGPGGWLILVEPEVHFGDRVLVPDIAGWRRERMPELPKEAHFTLAPDWVCEVVSPGTAGLDRIKKLPIYAAHAVKHAWLVDPLARTLEVYRLEGGRWSVIGTHEGVERVMAEPFEAFALDLSALWA